MNVFLYVCGFVVLFWLGLNLQINDKSRIKLLFQNRLYYFEFFSQFSFSFLLFFFSFPLKKRLRSATCSEALFWSLRCFIFPAQQATLLCRTESTPSCLWCNLRTHRRATDRPLLQTERATTTLRPKPTRKLCKDGQFQFSSNRIVRARGLCMSRP